MVLRIISSKDQVCYVKNILLNLYLLFTAPRKERRELDDGTMDPATLPIEDDVEGNLYVPKPPSTNFTAAKECQEERKLFPSIPFTQLHFCEKRRLIDDFCLYIRRTDGELLLGLGGEVNKSVLRLKFFQPLKLNGGMCEDPTFVFSKETSTVAVPCERLFMYCRLENKCCRKANITGYSKSFRLLERAKELYNRYYREKS